MTIHGSWSKYGGGRGGNESVYTDKEWLCQSCGQQRTKDDVVFMYYFNGFHLRVCDSCAKTDCAPLQKRMRS